jgi:hypothetical protein
VSSRSVARQSQAEARFSPRVFVMGIVFSANCGLSSHARLVACALADHLGPADDGGGHVAFASIARLVKLTRLSRASVVRALRELESGPRPVFERRTRAPWSRQGKRVPARVSAVRLILDAEKFRETHPERPRRRRLRPASPAPIPAHVVAGSREREVLTVSTCSTKRTTGQPATLPPAAPTAAATSTPAARPGGFEPIAAAMRKALAKLNTTPNGAQCEHLTLGRTNDPPAA